MATDPRNEYYRLLNDIAYRYSSYEYSFSEKELNELIALKIKSMSVSDVLGLLVDPDGSEELCDKLPDLFMSENSDDPIDKVKSSYTFSWYLQNQIKEYLFDIIYEDFEEILSEMRMAMITSDYRFSYPYN